MSLRMDCFELEHLIEDEKSVRALLMAAVHGGTPVRAYSGLYFNKWYKNLQIVVGSVIKDEEKSMEIVSSNAHCAGMSIWKCRVKEEITPKDSSELDMRLMVEPLSDDEHESKSFTVVDVMNADVLPSYAPGEIIQLQVIAKADKIGFYADEEAFSKAEGQKVKLPFGENGEKEEQTLTIAAGYPMPSRFMNNHFKTTKEEAAAAEFTDEDKWVYLRGKILKLATYSALFEGDEEHEEVKWVLPAIPVDTYFGRIDIMFNATWISEEQKEQVVVDNIISTVCEIQGDPLFYEYEKGMVIDKKNNMMAVRYAFSSGRMKRLLPILADNCRFYTDAHDKEIVGKAEIVKYLDEKYRYITEDQKCRQFTAYGFVVNDDEEIEQYSLQHKRGETCIAIGLNDGNQEGWSQFAFLEYDDEEKICGINLTNGDHYQFSDAFQSWVEMDEALKG